MKLTLRLFSALLILAAVAALAIPAHAASPDALTSNGNFEDGQGDWPTGWAHVKGGGTWEQEDGNHFLRLTAPKPDQMTMLYQTFKIPADTKALELTWRQRVTGLKRGSKKWFDARLLVEFKDATGQSVKGGPSPSATGKDTAGWETRKMDFLVPEGAVTVVLMPALFQVETGTLDLDDIDLRPTAPEPIISAAETKRADTAAKEATNAASTRASFKPREEAQPGKAPKELHTAGTKVLDSDGKEIWLQGVNTGGLESVAHDEHPGQSVIEAIDHWKANIIRLPVKGDFWFGHGKFQKQDGGELYRLLIDEAITLATNRGSYILLDLHGFRAPQESDIAFWKAAAERYKNNPAVLFDLFNEPHDVSWELWRNGGTVGKKQEGIVDESAFLSQSDKDKSNAGFHTVGMQALLDTVRSTGAKNICIVGGLAWSGDLSGVVNGFALEDKSGNGIIYGWHVYNWHRDWEKRVLGAAAKYPILVGEVGCDTHKMSFIPEKDQEDPFTWFPDMIGFIQKYKLNWTAWCMHPKAAPVLISDWDYTPTPFWGVPVKEALAGKQFELKKMR